MAALCAGGMCVADTAKVSVNLPLSVDIPLPYQVVRGEQVVLQGSVYNQQDKSIKVPAVKSTFANNVSPAQLGVF